MTIHSTYYSRHSPLGNAHPFHKLPQEIFVHILLYVTRPLDYGGLKWSRYGRWETSMWLPLHAICHHWNNTLISKKSLWNKIVVCGPNARQWLSFSLEHSAGVPFEVAFNWSSRNLKDLDCLLKDILPHAMFLRSITVTLYYRSYFDPLESFLRSVKLPRLTTLDISDIEGYVLDTPLSLSATHVHLWSPRLYYNAPGTWE
ncbi:uncharacterized protein BXZ73DRAFT_106027 [Epithele typhae]|uniref:uncharacterized protein n=1 Tax=Epithele typhae TaxID=378194 RepID=UPI002007D655|nr:uncharacterized protein BXZ73DRAFT_106027 [Epithele typhae]KAH9915962.1 hypothetical protein BXZ73DRAFT_106027 [Epithele typhae]